MYFAYFIIMCLIFRIPFAAEPSLVFVSKLWATTTILFQDLPLRTPLAFLLSDNGRLQVTASTSSICVKIPHHQLASSLRPLRLRSFTVRDLIVEATLSALRLLALLSCGEVFVNGHEVSKSDFDKSKEETNSNRHDSCQRWIVFTVMQLLISLHLIAI